MHRSQNFFPLCIAQIAHSLQFLISDWEDLRGIAFFIVSTRDWLGYEYYIISFVESIAKISPDIKNQTCKLIFII